MMGTPRIRRLHVLGVVDIHETSVGVVDIHETSVGASNTSLMHIHYSNTCNLLRALRLYTHNKHDIHVHVLVRTASTDINYVA